MVEFRLVIETEIVLLFEEEVTPERNSPLSTPLTIVVIPTDEIETIFHRFDGKISLPESAMEAVMGRLGSRIHSSEMPATFSDATSLKTLTFLTQQGDVPEFAIFPIVKGEDEETIDYVITGTKVEIDEMINTSVVSWEIIESDKAKDELQMSYRTPFYKDYVVMTGTGEDRIEVTRFGTEEEAIEYIQKLYTEGHLFPETSIVECEYDEDGNDPGWSFSVGPAPDAWQTVHMVQLANPHLPNKTHGYAVVVPAVLADMAY